MGAALSVIGILKTAYSYGTKAYDHVQKVTSFEESSKVLGSRIHLTNLILEDVVRLAKQNDNFKINNEGMEKAAKRLEKCLKDASEFCEKIGKSNWNTFFNAEDIVKKFASLNLQLNTAQGDFKFALSGSLIDMNGAQYDRLKENMNQVEENIANLFKTGMADMQTTFQTDLNNVGGEVKEIKDILKPPAAGKGFEAIKAKDRANVCTEIYKTSESTGVFVGWDPNNFIDRLINRKKINEEEKQALEKKETHPVKIETLLEIFRKKYSYDDYLIFIGTLKAVAETRWKPMKEIEGQEIVKELIIQAGGD